MQEIYKVGDRNFVIKLYTSDEKSSYRYYYFSDNKVYRISAIDKLLEYVDSYSIPINEVQNKLECAGILNRLAGVVEEKLLDSKRGQALEQETPVLSNLVDSDNKIIKEQVLNFYSDKRKINR